ncbi:MAG: MBOAT family O-acyltransferase [Anaerolineales bacterium]|jgi:D-alanyl-lipoteichoic acid acyltransferase DltB (MBOAT superfamily)
MTLLQILVGGALAVACGLFLHDRPRPYLLLVASVLAVFWFQPALPLREVDFWLPVATVMLSMTAWTLTATPESRRERENWVAAAIVLILILLLGLTRYLNVDPFLTASRPPQTVSIVGVLAAFALAFALLNRSPGRLNRGLWLVAAFLIAVFIILKAPALGTAASLLLRLWTGQSTTHAAASDLQWLGFSYIAFRMIHTLRDRQSGRLPDVNLAEYLTYIIFFPSLTAGPIDRIERFVQDLRHPMPLSQDGWLVAGKRLVAGLFKKFVLADTLALIALNATNALQVRTAGWAWLLLYAYAFEIYLDFSGYTDIAIGLGRMLGINLPENFNAPYLKPNLIQFWNSWHMTLTQWFRAYFFNPLTRALRSGRRPLPAVATIFVSQLSTMLLIGLWHGISGNFVIWGLWHGVGLFVNNRWSEWTRRPASAWAKSPPRRNLLSAIGVLVTFHYVTLGWVFFALPTPELSLAFLRKLVGMP